MIQNLIQSQLRKFCIVSWFLSCIFSVYTLNTNAAETSSTSYPAQLEGCVLGGTNALKPTCTESVIAFYNATQASCSQDVITEPQSVTCIISGTLPNGAPWVFTAEQFMYPNYACSYGGTGGPDISPYNCGINFTDIVVAKNLGEGCSKPYDGNPIHAGIGNKYAKELDYNSVSLDFVRYYNNRQNMLDRHIGMRWRHSYSRKLILNQDGASSSTFAERPDGSVVYFYLTESIWVNQQIGGDTLIQLTDNNGDPAGWQYKTADDTIETYNVEGKLLTITGRDSRTQTLTYDTNGRLTTVSDDVGRELGFTYDGSGRIETLTDPAGGMYWYDYDTMGNILSVTYPDARVRTYHYNEQAYTNGANLPNALTGITDENGARYATYTYDAQGRAIITEHAGGADRHELTYSDDGSNTVITDPLGSEYTRQFETILGVAKSIAQSQPAGSGCSAASSSTTYDMNGNIASRTDFNGNKTCYAFDLNRNLEIARVEGLSADNICPDVTTHTPAANTAERKVLTDWHTDFRLPVRITEANRETSLNYDSYGNITRLEIRDLATNTKRTWKTTYVYHDTVPGVLVQKTENGPRRNKVADRTTFDYYPPDENCTGGHFGCRGQVASITNALGHVTHIKRYNAHGQPEIITDPNGLTTTLNYDVRQRLISRTVGTETTDYQYDGVGQVIRVIFPDNRSLSYTYDDAHRLTQINDNRGNRIQYTLDAMGNRIQEEVFDPANTLTQTRQREFDALGRLWKDVGAQNQATEFGYDPVGNLKQATDPLQHTVANRFDALNRLIQSTDPLGGQTQQDLDALDQVTQVTDPKGVTTTYTTNALGDVLQEISADRGTTTYTYNAAGHVKTRTDARGVVHRYTYDALNRPVKRKHSKITDVPRTSKITWAYDTGTNGIGRLSRMTDESGDTAYSYDAQGRLLSKVQTTKFGKKSFTQSVNYQFDASGRLTQTTYPSGTRINTSYGADGRPNEIRVNGNVLIQNITYQPFGPVKSWVWGNGQTHSRSFDQDGRLAQHPLGSDVRSLTYDTAGQITATADINPVYDRNYEYDALGRLIRQSDNTSTRLWTFDANSNRTGVQSGSTVYPYTLDPSSNHLLNVAGPVAKTYTYDAAGNVLSDGISDYTWNAAGRLTKVVRNDKIYHYQYNGLGERTKKNGTGKIRHAFLYDAAGQLISEYQTNNIKKEDWQLSQETIWLDNIPIAVIKQPLATEPIQVYFVHSDHLNTPRLIVDSTNTPVWRWENWQAFGDNLVDEDPDGDGTPFEYNLRFAGQYFDKETNLHYNYLRDYEPETGRYLSSDPIGLAGGLNLFLYVDANTLSNLDPLGLRRIKVPRNVDEALQNLSDPAVEFHNQQPGINCEYGLLGCFYRPIPILQSQIQCIAIWCPPENKSLKGCPPPSELPGKAKPSLLHPGCYSICTEGPFMENIR